MNTTLLVVLTIVGFIVVIVLITVLVSVTKKLEPPKEDCEESGCSHCISLSACRMPQAKRQREMQEKKPPE